jgi:hypothetical protein
MLMHAVYDWGLVFSKSSHGHGANEPIPFDPPWQTFKDSFAHISLEMILVFFLLFILWLSRKVHIPKWLRRKFLLFKLIEPEEEFIV